MQKGARPGTRAVTGAAARNIRARQEREARERGEMTPAEFKARILRDPEWYIRSFLGQDTWGDLSAKPGSGLRGQVGIVHSVLNYRRTSVAGCVGSTKTYALALTVIAFLHAYGPSAEVYTTAPTFRQVKKVSWKEIRKVIKRSRVPLGGRLLDTEYKLDDDWFAIGFSPKDPDSVHGVHAKNLLIIIDEAQGVDQEIIEAAENAMAGGNAHLLLLFNPNAVPGQEAYECAHSKRALYNHITIDAFSTPNVRLRKTVIPGAIEFKQVKEWVKTYGWDSNFVRVKVRALYPKQAEDSVIPIDWIEKAMQREPHPDDAQFALELRPLAVAAREAEEATADAEAQVAAAAPPEESPPPEPKAGVQGKRRRAIGVDVARFGDDDSCLAPIVGRRVLKLKTVHGKDNAEVCGLLKRAIRSLRPDKVLVDEIGTGSGVVDMARADKQYVVKGVNVAEKAKNDEEFDDLRSELWWALREALDPTGDAPLTLPYDLDLMAELSVVRYGLTRRGRIRVESKDEIRKRLKRSPDRADAVVMANHAAATAAPVPSGGTTNKTGSMNKVKDRGMMNERPRATLGGRRKRLRERFGLG